MTISCKQKDSFNHNDILELSIADIHDLYKNGSLNAELLTSMYLERITAYDQPTKLNSIVLINPKAINTAIALDTEFQETGILRPLHGIPMIVKDNYNTKGLQTTGGSAALKGFLPDKDSYQVKKLKEAGAIILAKSNMAEWAFSPKHTISSIAGETLNPYNLDHVPAGSSGGTGAAVAANFGTIGLGTDTGNSIRGPSSHNALVGFRSTLGLTSRDGIIPLYLRNDVGGPMCRTVADATRILDVIAGYDPNDPITKHCEGRKPESYIKFLNGKNLNGKKIGILRELSDSDNHPEISTLFEKSIIVLKDLGAEIIDPFVVPNFDELSQDQWCSEFKKDLEVYLATHVKSDSLATLEDIIATGKYSNFAADDLKWFVENSGREVEKEIPCEGPFTDPKRIAFREAIENVMNDLRVDALIYPSWNYPPAKTKEYDEGYKGDNSQIIAPHTGQPAFTVPMGFTTGDLPAGLQFLGRVFDEATLIQICYAYEQATSHRNLPKLFPALAEN
ncbi:amidase family protein [Candidatus Neomarinimicrobiota bacterium]